MFSSMPILHLRHIYILIVCSSSICLSAIFVHVSTSCQKLFPYCVKYQLLEVQFP